jgi:hypothetical protein
MIARSAAVVGLLAAAWAPSAAQAGFIRGNDLLRMCQSSNMGELRPVHNPVQRLHPLHGQADFLGWVILVQP